MEIDKLSAIIIVVVIVVIQILGFVAVYQSSCQETAKHATRVLFYEYKVRDRHENILFLNKYDDFIYRMDRFYYDFVDAATFHPSLKVTLWGPGYYNYNENISANENIERYYGGKNLPTIVITSLDPFGYVPKPYNKKSQPIEIHEIGDCNHEFCHANYRAEPQIISLRYAHEIIDMFYKKDFQLSRENAQLFAHIPDCANRQHFYPLVDYESKTRKATLFGSTWAPFYPIRAKIAHGIQKNKIKTATIFYHVGYSMMEKLNQLSAEEIEYARRHPLNTSTAHYHLYAQNPKEFGKAMRESWICIFDSSIIRKTIRKYMEAMLSGCAIAGDIPFDFPDEYKDIIIPLDANWTYVKIDHVLQTHLDNKEDLVNRIERGLALARSEFICEKKVDRILNVVDGYRSGWRGYQFPTSFRIDCNLYYFGENTTEHNERLRKPWCR
jgi:hypothetical protein